MDTVTGDVSVLYQENKTEPDYAPSSWSTILAARILVSRDGQHAYVAYPQEKEVS